MKNLFIGINFSKEKIDATVISAIGLVEQSARVSNEFKSTVSGYRQLLKSAKDGLRVMRRSNPRNLSVGKSETGCGDCLFFTCH